MTINERHITYWIGPTIVGGLLVGMYFSCIPWMQSFVAPEVNREFGALENLQHLIIFAILVVAVGGIRRKTLKQEKMAFTGVATGSLFFLLEELDYGIHYMEYFSGETYKGGIRNLHNYILNPYGLDFDAVMSPVIYFILGFFFCFLPLVILKSTKTWLRYLMPETFVTRISADPRLRHLTPEPNSIGTVVAMVLVAQVAFFLDKIGMHSNLALRGNISEFGELFVFYIIFLYCVEIVYKRKTPYPDSVGTGRRANEKFLQRWPVEYPGEKN